MRRCREAVSSLSGRPVRMCVNSVGKRTVTQPILGTSPTTKRHQPMNNTIVQATDVYKTYHTGTVSVPALRGVSLNVQRKEVIAVMGPSGCGKTTLLNCLSGLDAADKGEIVIEGSELTEMSDYQRTDYRARRMGFVFQFYNLLPVLSAVENVEMPLLVSGVRPSIARQQALDALAQVGLAERAFHRPAELSGGERQRVTLARAAGQRPSDRLGRRAHRGP